MKIQRSRLHRALCAWPFAAALALPLLRVSPASAAFEVKAGAAAEGLPAPLLSAMSVQTAAMRPFLGDPEAMGQVLAQQALAPSGPAAVPNNIAAALVIQQALTDPVASAAVQKSLAAQTDPAGRQVSRDLAELRRSLNGKPEARAAFERTMRPLLARMQTGNMDIKEALDSIFSGSAQGISGGHKIEATLKPAPQGRARRFLEMAGAAAYLNGTVGPEGLETARAVLNTPAVESRDPFIRQVNDDYLNQHGYEAGAPAPPLSKWWKRGFLAAAGGLAAAAFGMPGLTAAAAAAAIVLGFMLVRRAVRPEAGTLDLIGAVPGQLLRLGGSLVLLGQLAHFLTR